MKISKQPELLKGFQNVCTSREGCQARMKERMARIRPVDKKQKTHIPDDGSKGH